MLQTGMWHYLRVLVGLGQDTVMLTTAQYKINALALFNLQGYIWICTCSKLTTVSLSEKEGLA